MEEDSLTRNVKLVILNELKRDYQDEAVTDLAGRLAIKEVVEFRARYPFLSGSKNLRKQLAFNVLKRLELLYPNIGPFGGYETI